MATLPIPAPDYLSQSIYADVWDRGARMQYVEGQKYLVFRFVMEPGIVSLLIGWRTDGLWCHTEGLSRDGKSWIGAHADTGVQARPLDWCKPTRETRYAIPVTDEEYDAAMTWLEAQEGRPYNYASIVGITIGKRMTNNKATDCSALMTSWAFVAKQVPLNTSEDFDYLITPRDLHLSGMFWGRRIYSFGSA